MTASSMQHQVRLYTNLYYDLCWMVKIMHNNNIKNSSYLRILLLDVGYYSFNLKKFSKKSLTDTNILSHSLGVGT